MIVCHCQNITDHDIHAAIDWMRASDTDTVITPGKVYRALGKAADCGGCLPLFMGTMSRNANHQVPKLDRVPAAAQQDSKECKATAKSSTTSIARSAAS